MISFDISSIDRCRVVYCSATGASEPRNLGYMTRLGLWGAAGSPFPGGFKDFLTAVDGRGVGAMELVAMHLKQTGSFVCRTLSFSGCGFEVCCLCCVLCVVLSLIHI